MKKRLLALFLAFVMAMSLLPVSVFADGGTGGQLTGIKDNPITASRDGVTVNKYVSVDQEGNYSLTLEAYAENKVTSTTTTTPLDIVLVLDTSGSMDESFGQGQGKKLSALKTAVSSFIDKVAENAKKTGTDHQISIVKFAGKASNNIGNETYKERVLGDWQTYNYSQIVTGLTSVKTGAENLKTQVSALIAGGATQADYGMEYAETVLKNARQDSEKVVIMFTDGEPTSGRDYEASVAHDAVNTAKELKDDGVTVYTIGIFSRANPSDTSGQTNKYMNAVSSNYPNAKSDTDDVYGISYRWTITLGIRGEGEYYFASSSAYGLEDVFNTIANTVTSSTLKVNPDATSVLSDTLSDYFNFPNGLTGADLAGVTVQKVRVTGKDSGGYTWGNAETVSGAKVTGKTIEVTGFDYKENAVTEETKNGETSYRGYKLVVTFPIKIDTDACNKDTTITNGYYPTNSEAKLSYKGSKDSVENNASTELTESPKVSYTKPKFTVKWMSQDGKTPLKTDENVPYGTTPSYNGDNGDKPTKPADNNYTYTFVGWATEVGQKTGVADTALPKVTGNVTYYAAFSETEITKYTVTYKWSGLPVGTTAKIPEPITGLVAGATYNVDSTYTSTTIVKDADGNQYTFSGWKLNGAVVAGAQTINTSSVELTGTWEKTGVPPIDPNPEVAAYKVEHYYVKGTQVTLHETEFPLYGEIGTTVNATAKTYNNYVYDPNYEETVASGVVIMPTAGDDGKPIILTLKLYYTYVPTVPEEKDLPGILGESAVRVNCVNSQVSHGVKNFGVLSGGCSIGAVEVDKDSVYTCTVTVNAAPYVAAYNQEYATAPIHTLIPVEAKTKTITLTWDDYKNEWIASLAAVPVHFDVKCQTYSLAYNANGGKMNGYDMFTALGIQANSAYKLGSEEGYSIPTKGDDVFMGWTADQSAGGKVYGAGEKLPEVVTTVEIPTVTTVYAVWRYDRNDDDGHHSNYTLYYHSNFGEDVSFYQSSSTRNVTVKEYDDVGRLLERDGYVFVSWNTEPDGSGSRYMPGDTFHIKGSSDHLYAQWQKDKTGPDDSGVSNWLETDEHKAYLTGYPDSTFRADRNMTRAEVAQMFYALLLDKNVTITKSFSDVPDDAWYATAVKTLASLGMMDGYPDGTFRPDEPITRAEFATVGLAFAYDPLDADCSYYDVSASAWYHTYVAQATTYGWIGGYPDNTFRPGNNITRVEVCVIVNNMLGRDADERYIDRHEEELVHFVDLSDSYWGYYTIMESTNTHEYTGNFTKEKWTDVK